MKKRPASLVEAGQKETPYNAKLKACCAGRTSLLTCNKTPIAVLVCYNGGVVNLSKEKMEITNLDLGIFEKLGVGELSRKLEAIDAGRQAMKEDYFTKRQTIFDASGEHQDEYREIEKRISENIEGLNLLNPHRDPFLMEDSYEYFVDYDLLDKLENKIIDGCGDKAFQQMHRTWEMLGHFRERLDYAVFKKKMAEMGGELD